MFLPKKRYKREEVDKTVFIRHLKSGLIVAQIYVDEIVFRSTSKTKSRVLINLMQNEFEMSIVGELNYFLG